MNASDVGRGVVLNSSGLPVREHFYASIEGGSDYESVSFFFFSLILFP